MSFVHVHSPNKGKLDPRAIRCAFVGYFSTEKGYKCYNPPSKRFYTSAVGTFHETKSYFSTPYLQGENLVMEDNDFFLIDLPSSSKSCLLGLKLSSPCLILYLCLLLNIINLSLWTICLLLSSYLLCLLLKGFLSLTTHTREKKLMFLNLHQFEELTRVLKMR